MQVQSVKVNCPELPKDYTDNFVVESTSTEGECCKEHKTVACKVGNKVYKVGETWPSPDGDKCKNVTCVQNKEELTKQESVQTCKKTCSKVLLLTRTCHSTVLFSRVQSTKNLTTPAVVSVFALLVLLTTN